MTTIRWVGTGRSRVSDVSNREFICYGEREEGGEPRVLRVFALTGWKQTSLHDVLLRGASSGARIEEIEPGTVRPYLCFDLPEGMGVGHLVHALARIVSPTSPVAAGAAALAAYHAHPTWFTDLVAALGGGNPTWFAGLSAGLSERGLVRDNAHWRRGAAVAAATVAHEKANGPRPQVTGWQVLSEGTGACPECGAAMIKTGEGVLCAELARKKDLPPGPELEELPPEAVEVLEQMLAAYVQAAAGEEA